MKKLARRQTDDSQNGEGKRPQQNGSSNGKSSKKRKEEGSITYGNLL